MLGVGIGLLSIALTAGFIIAEAVVKNGIELLIYTLVKGGVALDVVTGVRTQTVIYYPFTWIFTDVQLVD